MAVPGRPPTTRETTLYYRVTADIPPGADAERPEDSGTSADATRSVYALEFGGEDDAFAAAEARAAAPDVTVAAPGVGIAPALDPDRVRTLAFTHHASTIIDRTQGGVEAAETRLRNASIDRRGSVAVRARDVRGTAGVDTQVVERRLGTVLVDAGMTVDLDAPDHELRAVFTDDTVVLGWLVASSHRDYGRRRPTDRPFFQPGGMSPMLARALVNLGVPTDPTDAVVVDPMCGTGGTLIEAGLVGASPVGVDVQRHMVRGARDNLDTYLDTEYAVLRGDATTLPLQTGGVDAVVVDVPYGRQSKIAGHDPTDLVAGTLAETHRIAQRAVVVAATDLDDLVADAGWTLADRFERRVHRSLVRYVHVLTQ